MKVTWSRTAELDLEEIYVYGLNQWGVEVADRMDDRLLQTADLLGRQPGLGAPGLVAGTRDYIVDGLYRVVHLVDATAGVTIMTIVHYRKRYPVGPRG